MLFCATVAIYYENVVAQISNLSMFGESTECYSVQQLRFTARML